MTVLVHQMKSLEIVVRSSFSTLEAPHIPSPLPPSLALTTPPLSFSFGRRPFSAILANKFLHALISFSMYTTSSCVKIGTADFAENETIVPSNSPFCRPQTDSYTVSALFPQKERMEPVCYAFVPHQPKWSLDTVPQPDFLRTVQYKSPREIPAETMCLAQRWHGNVVTYIILPSTEIPRRAASVRAAISLCTALPNSIRLRILESFGIIGLSGSRACMTNSSVVVFVFSSLNHPFRFRNPRVSAMRSLFCSSTPSIPKRNSRLSGVSPHQYNPPPALGTSLHPTAMISPSRVEIAEPTCLPNSADLSAVARAWNIPYSSRVGVWKGFPNNSSTNRCSDCSISSKSPVSTNKSAR